MHVEYLARHLAKLVDVGVYCFGAPREDVLVSGAYEPWDELAKDGRGAPDVPFRSTCAWPRIFGAGLVHSHTWYANFAGYLAGCSTGPRT